jgi:hypothetical protein
LVVEGVGGEDRVGLARGDQRAEVMVAEVAGGFFNGFAMGFGVGGGVDGPKMEGNLEAGAEFFDEGLVGQGFFAAEGVVDVDRGEADAEGSARLSVGGMEQE